jgi:hypothetical protein
LHAPVSASSAAKQASTTLGVGGKRPAPRRIVDRCGPLRAARGPRYRSHAPAAGRAPRVAPVRRGRSGTGALGAP